ncbi:beta-lactamase domain protein [Bacillus cytotoxicus NVH 391-98]|uniref:Ribonuclease J n=2 Tax=Bacillus cytotoxicus TaxID=580165 RepID=A7GNE6_BACCN|nr:ribonuclease J [Bacillus cytotoxicus]ABS21654.1 beta-lactamase domain protein [Bacillus cytotoxicus NVH 391-98]AWC44353.1 ribonuclease J [Bacillus cytotoxicus]MDH2863016.1 ribonuclease J [Bacillus cytotoxicus]MDH2883055.1 ribonuclease J [Bacillus cytotoxicus]NZD31778.1 ribonuclease J [Bacillus cytotoxicus]
MSMSENTLSIFALGGVNEIGKNMYALQYKNEIVVVDCGSKFPDESLLGIDLIIPDITYLQENKEKIRGLFVTHGHEDHIGGIPYILKQLNIPIYASKLTLGLIELKLKEHHLQNQTKLIMVDSESEIELETMRLTFFKTNHSIPDCLGIAFHTDEGTVVHTGDFKFDLTPVNEQYPDIHKMANIGEKGVLALLSESTNAERAGFSPSERLVGERIEEAFQKAPRKVILSTFASNVNRVQQVVKACLKTKRKLALLGRSMVNVVSVAMEQGYLTIPEGMLIEADEINRLDPEKVAILCTGSQGEPMAALARLASGSYRQVEILPEDTVIIAATPIPGNERNVSRIIDNLFVLGANVIYGTGSSTGMHVSGHAYQEELKLMLTLMKPKYFIPIHGEFRMLHHHSLLAESVGVQKENIFIIKNGDVVDIRKQVAYQSRRIPAGNIYVDGLGIGDVGNALLRDRKQLSEDGMLIIVITLSKTDGDMISEPDIISRGFIYVRDSEEFLKEINQSVVETIQRLQQSYTGQWSILKKEIREKLGQFIYTSTKRKPMILPIIIEV